MKKHALKMLWIVPALLSLASCSQKPVVGPQGPAGQDGVDGEDGHSPVVTIGENGNWFIDGVDTNLPSKGDKGDPGKDGTDGKDGQDGKDGEDGEDGLTPYIGDNGNWWIGDTDTGIPAQGPQGDPGKDGTDGKDGQDGQDGIDGETPHIGANGNWFVDGVDTGIPSKGKDGVDGEDGEDGLTPYIGENGNWWIGDTDTGHPASTNSVSYKVTLDPNGGTLPEEAVERYQVISGSFIEDLPTPTRSGYEFLGWFTGEEANDGQFTTTTPVLSDLDLVARWRSLAQETYTVTWVDHDGRLLERDTGVSRNDWPRYDGETPTRAPSQSTAYVFSGWSPELSSVTADVTYVAQYRESPRVFTVKLDCGDYGSLSKTEYSVTYGDMLQEPYVDMSGVPGNVVLTGWYEDEGLTKKVSFPYQPKNDVTLYAGWETVEDVTDRLTFYYDGERDGYFIRSYNEDPERPVRSISIPDTYDDGEHGEKPVVGLYETFNANRNVETVRLPDSVEFIGDYCFANSAITSVNLPKSLESIGENAFYDTKITDVEFPSTLKEIGSSAFYDSNLGAADLSGTQLTEISDVAFYRTPIKTLSLPEGVTSIGSNAFFGCNSLTSVAFNEGLQSIGSDAFSQCDSLTSLAFNSGLQSIGGGTFYGCDSLTSVAFNEGLQSIGSNAFSGCSSLTSLEFNEKLQSIGNSAFAGCDSLASVVFNEKLQSIGDYAFQSCSFLTSVVIPESVTSMGGGAFNGCDSLTVYCKAGSMPESGWDSSFNGTAPVYWYSEENPGSNPGNFWHYNEEGEPWKW